MSPFSIAILASRKVQEDRWRSRCPVCGLLAMFRNRKWLFSDLPISVRKSTNIALHPVPAERRNKTLECWLNVSSAIMSLALQEVKAARIRVICKGASIAPHFLLARLQRYSFQFVFQLVFPAYTLQLSSICVLPTAFKTFWSNNLGILTGTSWHFYDISSDTSGRWGHESNSLDVNKANGMLTSKAQRIFCYNVTCVASKKSCSSRSHLSGCFKCSSLLACKAPRAQLSSVASN